MTELIEIGSLPEPLLSAKKDGKFVKLWANPEGKMFGKFFEGNKLPKEERIKKLDKRIAKHEGRQKELETEIAALKEVDASVIPEVNRKIDSRTKALAKVKERINKAKAKRAEVENE